MRIIWSIVLLITACSQETGPKETVDSAAPFELICGHKGVPVPNMDGTPSAEPEEYRISYRVEGQTVLEKTPDEENWRNVCEGVEQCEVKVSPASIDMKWLSSGGRASGILSGESVSIDRITGQWKQSLETGGDPLVTAGSCVKPEDRAF